MARNIMVGLGILVLVAIVILGGTLFTVNQAQQALVLRFGSPIREIRDPGLHVKVPFLDQVQYFDRRVLDFDAPSVELILGDQRRLVVDAYARYRIVSVTRFRQSTGEEAAFQSRLGPILFSSLRGVLGEASLFSVLSRDRAQLMQRIREQTNQSLVQFGVELVDLRIKRADLPTENQQAIFRRMQTERDREAKELRAQGAEIGQRIRARADRERRVLIAEAQKQAEIERGQGDAEATRIFAEAFGRDVDFFSFFRSMQAYRAALADGNTSVVLSPSGGFFQYFDVPDSAPTNSGVNRAAAPPAP